jgi:hypothetical protein
MYQSRQREGVMTVANHSAEWWAAKTAYEAAKRKVAEYTSRGRDPGGFARDLEDAAKAWKAVGGNPD